MFYLETVQSLTKRDLIRAEQVTGLGSQNNATLTYFELLGLLGLYSGLEHISILIEMTSNELDHLLGLLLSQTRIRRLAVRLSDLTLERFLSEKLNSVHGRLSNFHLYLHLETVRLELSRFDFGLLGPWSPGLSLKLPKTLRSLVLPIGALSRLENRPIESLTLRVENETVTSLPLTQTRRFRLDYQEYIEQRSHYEAVLLRSASDRLVALDGLLSPAAALICLSSYPSLEELSVWLSEAEEIRILEQIYQSYPEITLHLSSSFLSSALEELEGEYTVQLRASA